MSPSLPLLPALDGLRAVAVVAVIAYHLGIFSVRGGFLGVETFFVLSGYVITASLWQRWLRDGRPDHLGFWRRRARRLAPAYYLLVAVVAAALLGVWTGEAARIRSELIASLAFVSNWQQILAHGSYFQVMGRPSPLRHLWSLAIEMQFYLVWPLVLWWLAGRSGDRRGSTVAKAALGLVFASMLAGLLVYQPGHDPTRLYYGTDTRAAGLLLGSALALAWRPFEAPGRWSGRARGGADAVTGVLLLVLLCLYGRVDELSSWTYRGGIWAVSLISAALVALAVHPDARLAHAVLGNAAAQAVGRRSYSLYLWHWPVFVLLGAPRPAGHGLARTACLLALTAALAELSYRFVEEPVRRGRLGEGIAHVRRSLRGGTAHRRSEIVAAWSVMGLLGVLCVAVLGVSLAQASEPPPAFDATPRTLVRPQPASGPTGVDTGRPDAGRPDTTGPDTTGADPTGADPGGADPGGADPGGADRTVTTRALPPTTLPPPLAEPAPGSGPLSTATATAPTTTAPATATSGPASPAATVTSGPTPPAASVTVGAAPPPAGVAPPPVTSAPQPGPAMVVAVGDSVLLSAADALHARFPSLQIDASVGRQPSDGVDQIRAWRQGGGNADTLVVQLGDNGQLHGTQVEDIMAIVNGIRRVIFVNVHVPRAWEQQVNDTLAEVVPRFGNAVLVDWHTRSADCGPDTFSDDGVHLTAAGAHCYAMLVAAAGA